MEAIGTTKSDRKGTMVTVGEVEKKMVAGKNKGRKGGAKGSKGGEGRHDGRRKVAKDRR